MPNAAEELGYPGWVVAFVAFVIFVMGAVVIYAAVSFINLTIFFNEWGGLDRVAYVVLCAMWGHKVWQYAGEE